MGSVCSSLRPRRYRGGNCHGSAWRLSWMACCRSRRACPRASTAAMRGKSLTRPWGKAPHPSVDRGADRGRGLAALSGAPSRSPGGICPVGVESVAPSAPCETAGYCRPRPLGPRDPASGTKDAQRLRLRGWLDESGVSQRPPLRATWAPPQAVRLASRWTGTSGGPRPRDGGSRGQAAPRRGRRTSPRGPGRPVGGGPGAPRWHRPGWSGPGWTPARRRRRGSPGLEARGLEVEPGVPGHPEGVPQGLVLHAAPAVAPDQVVPVERVQEEDPPRPEHPPHLPEDAEVLLLRLEVPEGREEVEDGVEPGAEGELPHVAPHPPHGGAPPARQRLGLPQQHRAEVESRDPIPPEGELDGVASVAAAQVEDVASGRKTPQGDKTAHLARRRLRGEPGAVGEEVALVELLRVPGPAGQAGTLATGRPRRTQDPASRISTSTVRPTRSAPPSRTTTLLVRVLPTTPPRVPGSSTRTSWTVPRRRRFRARAMRSWSWLRLWRRRRFTSSGTWSG